MSMVTILCICAMLYIINRAYLTKIENLQGYVNLYATSKDIKIADRIDTAVTDGDEFSIIMKNTDAGQTDALIALFADAMRKSASPSPSAGLYSIQYSP